MERAWVVLGRLDGLFEGRNYEEQGCILVDAPVVHEPLEWQVEVVDNGVRVHEHDNGVLLQGAPDDRGLLPRVSSVIVLAGLDKVVLVAVDLGCEG
jgi:hypothetical protein